MQKASIIITNARLITMDKAKPFATAMAISGNRILRVGSAEDVTEFKGSKTRIVDAKGASVIPGIIEGHVHLFPGAVELDALNINSFKGLQAISDSSK